MKNLDDYITGQYDPNAPFNQPDEDSNLSIRELIESGQTDLAMDELKHLENELRSIRDIIKLITCDKGETKNTYLFKRINKAIQLI